MTIDERLDRLTERHEALSQSVESLLHAQQETDSRLKAFIDVSTDAAVVNGRLLNRLETKVEDHDQQLAALQSLAHRQSQFLEQHESVMRGIDERLAKLTDLILKGYRGNGGQN